MTQAEFDNFIFKVLEQLRITAPRDTGNLAENAMQKQVTGMRGEIFIDLSVAPYQYYLEEGTENSKKWVGWWEKQVEAAVRTVSAQYNGEVKDV